MTGPAAMGPAGPASGSADRAATSSRATAALVLGILGVVCCVLTGPIAWILGTRELRAIQEGRAPEGGRGFARAGQILGIVGTALLPLVLLLAPALVIPNFLDALQRAKQRRTESDIRALGAALVTYCGGDDGGGRNEAAGDGRGRPSPCAPGQSFPAVERLEGLRSVLVPAYLGDLPQLDGWKNELRYRCWNDAPSSFARGGAAPRDGCAHVALVSAGRDGLFEHDDPRDYAEARIDRAYDRDIVWIDGRFVQAP